MYIANRIFENVCAKYTPSSVKRFFFFSVSKVAITLKIECSHCLFPFSSFLPPLPLLVQFSFPFFFASVIFELIGHKKLAFWPFFNQAANFAGFVFKKSARYISTWTLIVLTMAMKHFSQWILPLRFVIGESLVTGFPAFVTLLAD